MSKLESHFSKLVKKKLESFDKLWYVVKEAKSLRGIPDILGCYYGHFFAIELKKSESESRKNTGRIVLQKYTLRQIDLAGGFGYIAYPENLEEVLTDLQSRCVPKR